MYEIKRYANGRFYDTVTKNYITRQQLADLITEGKKLKIVETKTGKDITDTIVSQVKAKQGKKAGAARKKTAGKGAKKGAAAKKSDTSNVFMQLVRKSGDALFDYGKRYASMWQNLVTMSRDEIDRLVNMLIRENKITETEGRKLVSEIERYRDNVQDWITRNIDQRVNEVLGRMNLANRDQVVELTKKVEQLNKKITSLEKSKKGGKSSK